MHFGQYSGKFSSTVSSRIFNRVLLPQKGHKIHSIFMLSSSVLGFFLFLPYGKLAVFLLTALSFSFQLTFFLSVVAVTSQASIIKKRRSWRGNTFSACRRFIRRIMWFLRRCRRFRPKRRSLSSFLLTLTSSPVWRRSPTMTVQRRTMYSCVSAPAARRRCFMVWTSKHRQTAPVSSVSPIHRRARSSTKTCFHFPFPCRAFWRWKPTPIPASSTRIPGLLLKNDCKPSHISMEKSPHKHAVRLCGDLFAPDYFCFFLSFSFLAAVFSFFFPAFFLSFFLSAFFFTGVSSSISSLQPNSSMRRWMTLI